MNALRGSLSGLLPVDVLSCGCSFEGVFVHGLWVTLKDLCLYGSSKRECSGLNQNFGLRGQSMN